MTTAGPGDSAGTGGPTGPREPVAPSGSGGAGEPPPPASPSSPGGSGYPARFSVDYPDRSLDRLTTAFRVFTVIPIMFVLGSIGGWYADWSPDTGSYVASGTAVLTVPPALMILFREKYPRWWLVWNLELQRFTNRVFVYLALMDDHYPSTDEEQSVRLDFDFPDAKHDLNRWLPLVKWFLAIPHYFVLLFLGIGAFFAVVFAWFAILFTGRYPRGLFDYVEGVFRWGFRVEAYAFMLVTDRYPPFSLKP